MRSSILFAAFAALAGLSSTPLFAAVLAQAEASAAVPQVLDEMPSLTPVPLPSKKSGYPEERWFEGWTAEIVATERRLQDPDSIAVQRETDHWNRFLLYFKALTDDPADLSAVFMDAYRYERHAFAAEYAEWIPRLTTGNYGYCAEYYGETLTVLDELVRLLLDSYDRDLQALLVDIEERDQHLRATIASDTSSTARTKLLEEQHRLDLQNLELLEPIFTEHGYPGRSLVGIELERVAFLVIQHAGGEAIRKHLPDVRRAVEARDLSPSVYPYLFDRNEVSSGRPQCFGTQRRLEDNSLYPIDDPERVNERRRRYGLAPLEDAL